MSITVPLEGFGSGGNPLNFKVVGGTSKPGNPKENTIWINTDTEITSWIFSTTQPAGEEGMVWFSTGAGSSSEFNALKKNNITVNPMQVKQYIDGAWVKKEGFLYQNGTWIGLLNDKTIFANGAFASGFSAQGHESVSVSVSNNRVGWSGYTGCVGMDILPAVNLTPYKTLKINMDCMMYPNNDGVGYWVSFGVSKSRYWAEKGSDMAAKQYHEVKSMSRGNYTVDISSLSGEYYIKFTCYAGGTSYMNVYSIELLA